MPDLRVLVCVKRVAVVGESLELVDGEPRADLVNWVLNQWDGVALAAALSLCDRAGTGEVVVVTVDDEAADEMLRECLACGAHRAIRIPAVTAAGGDPLAVGRLLAAVAEREIFTIVLAGAQSEDMSNAATGAAVAGYLDAPLVALVKSIELDDEYADVERELSGGRTEVLRVRTPAVLTVQTGSYTPKQPTLRQLKQARQRPVEIFDLAAAGLSENDVRDCAGTRRLSLAQPEAGRRATMIDGDVAQVASRIHELVRSRVG